MNSKNIKIGVLALQGAFHLHKPHLEALKTQYVEVIHSKDLNDIDALILPGGESGVMLKLMETLSITQDLKNFLHVKPAWGICAGAILMADSVYNPLQKSLGVIDIEIERNAYGRQYDSFEEEIDNYHVSFIRAPKIKKIGSNVQVKSRKGIDPIWVESKNLIVTTFHPETNNTLPSPWHKRLLEFVHSSRLTS